jgi:hypothetical protein
MEKALLRLEELLSRPARGVSKEQEEQVFREVPGIVERLRN